MVGSPRMKSFTRMTAPAGSDISFSTFPEVTGGTTTILVTQSWMLSPSYGVVPMCPEEAHIRL